MRLKIVCFEDDERHREILKDAFAEHDAQFRFFPGDNRDWNVTPERAKEISDFAPDIAIVDLRDDISGNLPGFRTIRQLRESPETSRVPVIAWSVLLRESPEGLILAERAQGLGATPLYKSSQLRPSARRFLDAAGKSSS